MLISGEFVSKTSHDKKVEKSVSQSVSSKKQDMSSTENIDSFVVKDEKSLVEDHPEYYDPRIKPKFARYEVETNLLEFSELREDVQRAAIAQLLDLRKLKNEGIFVPLVDEYTNPFAFIDIFLF